MSAEAFRAATGVSRETIARLETYAALLRKWNPAINLVARNSLSELWDRHFLDSAQLLSLAPETARHWADLGSGGGFPGLVIAILAAEQCPALHVTCVESDSRKSVFLRTVARETGLDATILTDRIEALAPLNADILSARALAPLPQLIAHAERHLAPGGVALFPKGATAAAELADALATFTFRRDEYPSRTDSAARILAIGDIGRV